MFRIHTSGRFGLIVTLAIAATFLFGGVTLGADDTDIAFLTKTLEEGNRAFDENNFESAISAYEKAVDLGYVSPEMFLLLGNAHYRTGSDGEAALWWRRAQITDPLLAEPAQNLRFLDSKAGLLRFDTDAVGKVTGFLPRDLWTIITTVGGWSFVIGIVALSLHLPRKLWRGIAHLFCWIGLAVAGTGFAGYLLKTNRDIPFVTELAIATKTTSARTSATDDGALVTELPAGSEITLLGDRGPWIYVGIPGNLRGWIRSGTATALWPFDPAFLN